MSACVCAADPKKQIEESLFNRSEDFKSRRPKQIQTGDFPTTTIGSFPQTAGSPYFHDQLSSVSHTVDLKRPHQTRNEACCTAVVYRGTC